MQFSPYRFPLSRESEWFEHTDLSPATVALAKSLIYERGKCACFADLALLGELATETERHDFLRVLSRIPAIVAKIHLSPDTDLQTLVSYWSKIKSSKDIKPLIESFQRSSELVDISLPFFLPAFARNRLYTFPDQADDSPSGMDCVWTALNFHNSVPDARFLDIQFRDKILVTHYELVQASPVLGDMILIANTQGKTLHTCIYIADNLVFTKNGATRVAPWLLMDMDDMLAYYQDNPIKIILLRAKQPSRIQSS